MTMSKFDALKQITTYVVKNRLKTVLDAELPHTDIEVNEVEVFDVSQRISFGPTPIEEPHMACPEYDGLKDQRL